jgi:hypothetical protein
VNTVFIASTRLLTMLYTCANSGTVIFTNLVEDGKRGTENPWTAKYANDHVHSALSLHAKHMQFAWTLATVNKFNGFNTRPSSSCNNCKYIDSGVAMSALMARTLLTRWRWRCHVVADA